MRTLAILQGIFYFATGVWPILSIRTFQMVTGPKTDLWLVKTVGVLIAVIGLVLTASGLHDRVTFEIVMLATASAALPQEWTTMCPNPYNPQFLMLPSPIVRQSMSWPSSDLPSEL